MEGIIQRESQLKLVLSLTSTLRPSRSHHHGSTYYEHLAFLKAIKNNSVPEVSLSDGLIAVAVGEAAEKSIKLGRLINIEEIIN